MRYTNTIVIDIDMVWGTEVPSGVQGQSPGWQWCLYKVSK